MANIKNGNTFYVDAASVGGTASSFINIKNIKVSGIILSSGAAGDSVTLNDLDTSGPSAGDLKVTVKVDDLDGTEYVDLSDQPIVFPNGIWVSAIDAGAEATLILRTTST